MAELHQDWLYLQDACGHMGEVSPLLDALRSCPSGRRGYYFEELMEILLIPGTLCSAIPAVARVFIEEAPKWGPRACTTALEFIEDWAETVAIADREMLVHHSAIEPYSDYDALEAAIIESVDYGRELYARLFLQKKISKWDDRRCLAGVLLSYCKDLRPEYLDRYDEALAACEEDHWKRRILVAASKVAEVTGALDAYTDRSLLSSDPLVRFVASMRRVDRMDDDALLGLIRASGNYRGVSATELVESFPTLTKIRVYEAVFRAGIHEASALSNCAELLRLVFDERATITVSLHCSRESRAQGDVKYHTEYRFRSGPPPPIQAMNGLQRRALAAIAEYDFAWKKRTNLWSHFGLPETRDGLRALLADPTYD